MKVTAVFEDGTAGVVERPTPSPKDDNVLIKIHVAATCTEYKSYRDGTRWDFELGEPVAVDGPNVGDSFGHEAVGEVVEVAKPGQVEVGDRVVVMWWRGCGACPMCVIGEIAHCRNPSAGARSPRYAQYVLQKDWLCSPIPDGVSYKHASAGLCGMGPSFEAMDLMRLDAFDTVLITGLGPVGLGGVINASYRGARIIAVESIPFRAELGRELGAEVVLDPSDGTVLEQILDLTDGVGVDKAVDCSASAQAQRLCIDAVRPKGHVGFPGEGSDFTFHVLRDLGNKGLTLRGNWTMNYQGYPRLMKVIQESGDKLDKYISHTFPMSQVQKAWELQATGACGKVVLDPWR